ncbi:MAG TPA: glycosyltransferase [Ktedonobacterales bacterium]|nr:glycosyltransferase [Ktedonobacterales bacterium]
MRIALLAPLVSPIAPPFLGGAQAFVYDLAVGLAARGHQVTLYAAEGSAVPGVEHVALGIDAGELRPARFDEVAADAPDATFFTHARYFLRVMRHVRAHAGAYDLLHAHAYDWPAIAFGALLPLPVLHTLHLPAVNAAIRGALAEAARREPDGGNTSLATVSRACAASYLPDVHIEHVIYNGLDLGALPFGAAPAADPYLLFAGRMAPEKGVADALAIARAAGMRLVLAGGMYDQAYFEREVAPLLEPLRAADRAEYLGLQPRERVWELMAGASAVLAPSHWAEPFGLAPCEAMACGAPVIGYATGALPEVVADGETGWLVPPGDIAAAAAAVARVGELERAACRARVAERFSIGAMLDGYEHLYRRISGAAAP